MKRIRCIAAILGGLAASVLVALTGTTAAFAYVDPAPGGPAAPVHPAREHTIVTGGMPGWQVALIALGARAAIFAAALAVTLDRVRTAHRQLTAPGA